MNHRPAVLVIVLVAAVLLLSLSTVGAQSGNQPAYYASISDLLTADPPDGTAVELQCKPVYDNGVDGAYGNYFTLGEDVAYDTIRVFYTGEVTFEFRVNRVSGQIRRQGTSRVLCVNSGPGYNPGGYIGRLEVARVGTIASVKALPDSFPGETLRIPLYGKIVSRTFPGLDCLYIQEPDGSDGIRISDSSASTIMPGDLMDIYDGQLVTVDGERMIISTFSSDNGPDVEPRPFGIGIRNIGGGDRNVFTPGPIGGFGLNNVGLFARSWGRVTSIGSGFFYMSEAQDTGGVPSSQVRVNGAYGYMPRVGDTVAISGVAGISTASGDPEKLLRMASISDLQSLSITPHPMNPLAISTGSGKISVYWDGVSGVSGYNVYRGTTSGGEDYAHPLNGSAPVTSPTYTGGKTFMFTDTGLVNGSSYYYTVRSISSRGLSSASAEVSEIPSPDAVPWDSADVASITSAIQSVFYPAFDYVRAVGPDGRIYDSWQATPQMPDGTVLSDSDIVQLSTGEIVPAPNDSGEFGSAGATSGLNASDCVYRRVKSNPGYYGASGDFYLPGMSSIFLMSGYKDVPYIHFGSLNTNPALNVNAGLRWSVPKRNWEVFQTSCIRSDMGDQRFMLNYTNRALRNFKAGQTIYAAYSICDWAAMTALIVEGLSDQSFSQAVCVANACPVKQGPSQIKRVHSIARGGPPWTYISHGSYIRGEQARSVNLLDSLYNPVSWTPAVTSEQGAYPSSSVSWRVLTAYSDEDQINVGP